MVANSDLVLIRIMGNCWKIRREVQKRKRIDKPKHCSLDKVASHDTRKQFCWKVL